MRQRGRMGANSEMTEHTHTPDRSQNEKWGELKNGQEGRKLNSAYVPIYLCMKAYFEVIMLMHDWNKITWYAWSCLIAQPFGKHPMRQLARLKECS